MTADGVKAASVHRRTSTVPEEETKADQETFAPGLACGEMATIIPAVAPLMDTVVSLQPTVEGAVAETLPVSNWAFAASAAPVQL